MSVSGSDMKWYKSANHPTDDASTAGGAISATELTDGQVGQLLTRMAAPASGTLDDDAEFQYQQVYLKNTHGTDDALNVLIYIKNGLKVPGSAGVAKFASTSASDDNTKKIRVHGVRQGQTVVSTEDVVLNGTTEVSGVATWAERYLDEVLNVADDTPATLVGDGTSKNGSETIGTIPAGKGYATGQVDLWVPSTTGTSLTSTNRKTAPAGASWTRAVDAGTALSVRNNPSDDTMAAGVAQAVWLRQKLQPGQHGGKTDIDCVMAAEGD